MNLGDSGKAGASVCTGLAYWHLRNAKVFWSEWHVQRALRKRLLYLVKDKVTKK
jgi:hypothetical protein